MNIPVVILATAAVVAAGFFALRRFESLKGKSTEELRTMMRGPEWAFYRNALAELRRRGEDIKPEVVPVLTLLISDVKQHRIAGWLLLREFYPDLAARIPDYKPQESSEACKEKMQRILLRENA